MYILHLALKIINVIVFDDLQSLSSLNTRTIHTFLALSEWPFWPVMDLNSAKNLLLSTLIPGSVFVDNVVFNGWLQKCHRRMDRHRGRLYSGMIVK